MDSYEKDAIRRKHSFDKRARERAARDAPRQQYLARYAAAEAAALATIKANKDYNIIVEYLADCSTAEVEHIILDVLMTDVMERGCALTSTKIRSFLERDLKLKTWEYQGDVLVRTPHGWTMERGPYSIDVETIWKSWVWVPPIDSEWAQ